MRLPILASLAALVSALSLQGADTTLTYQAAADTYANPGQSTKNYGLKTYLTVDATSAGSTEETAYLRFDIPGPLPGPVISATLRVRALNNLGTLSVYSVEDTSWEELGLTWNNRPAIGPLLATASAPRNTTPAFNLNSALASFTGGSLSFALTTNTSVAGDIASREYVTAAYRPVLELVISDSNRAPVAVADSYDIAYQTARTIAAPGVLENDYDPDSDPFTALLVSGPSHGSLTLQPDGSFTYTPDQGYHGLDSFSYKTRDTHTPVGGGASSQLDSAPVTVSLNILFTGDVFPASELALIQNDLGVALSPATQLDLYNLVHPAQVEPWRTDAEAHIAQHRKSALSLKLTDAAGQPLPGAVVEFRQRTKPFKFGGVLDLRISAGLGGASQPALSVADYKARAIALFDAFGLNNGLKPKQMGAASDPNSNQSLLPAFFSWAAAANRPVRGHLLIWPGLDHLSATVEAKVLEAEAIINLRDEAADPSPERTALNAQLVAKQAEVRAVVDAEITDWASRWNVYQWDVLNEALSNVRVQNILDDPETNPGNIEMLRWFQLAAQHRVQPAAGLFINEFQIISGNNEARFPAYKALIETLQANAAPISGIGFQSRFKFRRESPELLYSRLEQFAGYGLDLYGTEFEVRPDFGATEKLRAQITEEVMTTYFSHPSVKGLFAWTYCHPSYPAETLLDTNGTPKLNALVWYYLNRIRYSTRTSLTADSSGVVTLSAFKGDYDLLITTGGSTTTVPFTLDAGGERTLNTATGVVFSGPPPIVVTDQTYAATADAHVRNGIDPVTSVNYAATNYGNQGYLELRRTDVTVNGRLAYLKFNLPALAAPVTNVVLRLRVPTAGATPGLNGEINPIHVFSTTNDWIESGVGGITWDTRPATGTFLGGRSAPADSWLEIALPPSAIPPAGGTVSFILDEQGGSFGRVAARNLDPDGTGTDFVLGDYAPRLRIVTASNGVADTTDTDGDTLPDAWEFQHGLDANTVTDPSLDPDLDGRSHLLEYLLGRDPAVFEPLSDDLRIEPGASPGRLRVVFRRSAAGPRALFNTTLTGAWLPLDTGADLTAAGLGFEHHSADTDANGITTESYEFTLGTAPAFFIRLGQ